MLCFSAFVTCVKLRESYVSFRMLIKLPVAPHCNIFSVFFKLFSFLFYWILTLYSFLLVFIAILVFIDFVVVFVFIFIFSAIILFLKEEIYLVCCIYL